MVDTIVPPERSSSLEPLRTNDSTPEWRLLFVVGISGAKPKTRAFVTERTWAYQTKSAFSDPSTIAACRFIDNRTSQRGDG